MFLKKFLLTHEYAFLCMRVNTYSIAMPQCFPALSPAAWKPDRPIRVMVGVMVKGPMYFSRSPGRPSAPMHTSTMDDTMIAPWIWQNKHIIKMRTKRVQWHDEKNYYFLKWSRTIKSNNTAVLNYVLLKSTTQAHEAQVQAQRDTRLIKHLNTSSSFSVAFCKGSSASKWISFLMKYNVSAHFAWRLANLQAKWALTIKLTAQSTQFIRRLLVSTLIMRRN